MMIYYTRRKKRVYGIKYESLRYEPDGEMFYFVPLKWTIGKWTGLDFIVDGKDKDMDFIVIDCTPIKHTPYWKAHVKQVAFARI